MFDYEFFCEKSDHVLTQQWRDALRDVVIRHHDPLTSASVTLRDAMQPQLELAVHNVVDTGAMSGVRSARLVISTVKLCHFPGAPLARVWLACAWASYLQHEALELVTVSGNPTHRCLDPHRALPFFTGHRLAPFAHDRGLRDGLPPELTPAALLRALCAVMDEQVAAELVHHARSRGEMK